MTDAGGVRGEHVHDDVDWAAMAATLSGWDELEEERNRAIVDWLGVRPGQVVVDVGSGAGGMAAALLGAVGTAGTVVIVDGALELLTVARQRVERPGYQLVAVHADLEQQPLSSVLALRGVDLVHASAVVHHLHDELAAIQARRCRSRRAGTGCRARLRRRRPALLTGRRQRDPIRSRRPSQRLRDDRAPA